VRAADQRKRRRKEGKNKGGPKQRASEKHPEKEGGLFTFWMHGQEWTGSKKPGAEEGVVPVASFY